MQTRTIKNLTTLLSIVLLACLFQTQHGYAQKASTKKGRTTTTTKKPVAKKTKPKKVSPPNTSPQRSDSQKGVPAKESSQQHSTPKVVSEKTSTQKPINQHSKSTKRGRPSQTPFHQGSSTLAFGLGAGIDYDYYGDIASLPSFFVSYDYGIINKAGPGNIGIGGILAIKSATYRYSYGGYKATWRNYIIGARGTWHLTVLAKKNFKFDPYGGVTLGLRLNSYNDSNPYYSDYDYGYVYPIVGAFVGARYNFKTRVGVFAELGYDISFFRGGLNINF